MGQEKKLGKNNALEHNCCILENNCLTVQYLNTGEEARVLFLHFYLCLLFLSVPKSSAAAIVARNSELI